MELSGSWQSRDRKRKINVSVDDMLRRTVFYKVGHHGSHNATLRQYLREYMQRGELAAMIPVDQKRAEAKGWKMPFEELREDLIERTGGRLIIADEPKIKKPSDVTQTAWQQWKDRVDWSADLYVDYWVK